MKNILLPLFFFLPLLLVAKDGVKTLKKKTVYSFSFSDFGLVFHEQRIIQKQIIDVNKALQYEIRERVYIGDFEKIKSISAYTLVPKRGKFKKVKVKSFPEVDYTPSGIFYSGIKKKIVTYPAIENGAQTYLNVEKTNRKVQLIPAFYFSESELVDTSVFEIRVPKGVDIAFNEFLYEYDSQINYSQQETKYETIHRWVGANFKKDAFEKNDLGSSCRLPHIIVRVKSFGFQGKRHNVFRDEKDLFSWYSSLIQEEKISADYQSIVDSLNTGGKTDVQKASGILSWVQRNIKYVAYEDGMGGFRPRTPNSVLKNRYGDCKDMSFLTKTLMNACGLKCEVAWIGTRDKCYSYYSSPTPATDNHMIAVVPVDTGYLFLDPTSRFLPYGVPSSFIQGKEAMIYKSKTAFDIVKVPFVSSKENIQEDKIEVKLNGQVLSGKGTNKRKGYQKIDLEYGVMYSDLTKKEFWRDELVLGNNSFQLSDYFSRNVGSNQGEIVAKYSYSLKNYVQKFGDQIYFSPFLKDVVDLDLKTRKTAFVVPYKYKNKANVRFEIPEGVKVSSEIKSVSIEENGLQLEIEVKRGENVFEISYAFTNNIEVIHLDQFDQIKSTLKKFRGLLKQQLTLQL